MTFPQRVFEPMKRLVSKLVEWELHAAAAHLSELLYLCKSGKWDQLDGEEQLKTLEGYHYLFQARGPIGDSPHFDDPDFEACSEILDTTREGLRRRLPG